MPVGVGVAAEDGVGSGDLHDLQRMSESMRARMRELSSRYWWVLFLMGGVLGWFAGDVVSGWLGIS